MGTGCHPCLVQELLWVQWWGQDGETGLGGLGQTFGQFLPQFLTCVKYLQILPYSIQWSLVPFYS